MYLSPEDKYEIACEENERLRQALRCAITSLRGLVGGPEHHEHCPDPEDPELCDYAALLNAEKVLADAEA